MKVYVAGDVHGKTKAMTDHIYRAAELNIQHIIVCGDFGLWTHESDGHHFLDEVNEAATEENVNVFVVGGNHENWDHWEWMVKNNPKTGRGFAMARSRVLLAPKVHKWQWDNKQFMCAGGGVSVDKEWRQKRENGWDDTRGIYRRSLVTGPRTIWWPNEELTDDDVKTVMSWHRNADYLFTHDCSNYSPWGNRIKDDIDSQNHRRRIDAVLRAVKPYMHFHGHMHERYDWINSIRVPQGDEYPEGWHDVETYGLEHDYGVDSWGVLDTQSDEFIWGGVMGLGEKPSAQKGLESLYDDVEKMFDNEPGSLIQKIARVSGDM